MKAPAYTTRRAAALFALHCIAAALCAVAIAAAPRLHSHCDTGGERCHVHAH